MLQPGSKKKPSINELHSNKKYKPIEITEIQQQKINNATIATTEIQHTQKQTNKRPKKDKQKQKQWQKQSINK